MYSWDSKAYKYTTVQSSKPSEETNELDEYVFVVRTRFGKSANIFR